MRRGKLLAAPIDVPRSSADLISQQNASSPMLRVAAANFRVVAERRSNLDRAAALGAAAAAQGAHLFVRRRPPAASLLPTRRQR